MKRHGPTELTDVVVQKNTKQIIGLRDGRLWAAGIAFLTWGTLAPVAVQAQTGIDPMDGTLRPADIYGNAQAYRPDRRALNLYQNDIQREALASYLDVNRRIGQRGYGSAFSLPGDLLSAAVNRYTGATYLRNAGRRRPTINGVTEGQRRAAFGSYGGFGRRRSYYEEGDPAAVIARRRELILATGLNAPVERAMQRNGALPGLRWSVSRTPFLATEAGDEVAPAEIVPTMTLDERLATQADVLHARTRAEAWAHFRDGDYRRAMRSFESAAMLDPEDYESRVGEIFCDFSIGAVRTAFALLLELERRDPNPFEPAFSMADRFGAVSAAQRVRLSAQGGAEATEQSAEANALNIFVLWYMDRPDDALRAAKALAVKAPDRLFVTWPDKMRAAMAAAPAAAP